MNRSGNGSGNGSAGERAGPTALGLALIVAVALGVRLALWPFATAETGDAASRVWMAWDWLGHPTIVTQGVWGPLHLYLIAPVLWWFQEPVDAPVALHIILASLTPVVVYLFTRDEFGGWRASLIVALVFALYPVGIRNSLMALSEAPFVLLLATCLVFLARARRAGGRPIDALLAGFSLTLACMLRYEGWMLLPFLAILLWRQPRLMLMFAGVSLIHPVFWMIGNHVHSGDPFYSFNSASRWERDAMGRSAMPIGARVHAVLLLGWLTVRGLTPLVAAAAAFGAGLTVLRRSRQAVWLVPCGGLFALLAIGGLRSAFVPRPFYIATFALFMIPYLAVVLNQIGLERLSRARFALVAVAGAACVLLVSVPDAARTMPVVRWLAGISPVPEFVEQDAARRLIDLINPQLRAPDDGFVSDFYGWVPSYYVALRTRLHPDRIFLSPGAPNEPLDLAALGGFLDRHPNGVLLVRRVSRLGAALGLEGDHALVEGRVLALVKVADVPWPPPAAPAVSGTSAEGQGDLSIFRYQRR